MASDKVVRRRRYSEELKAQVMAECDAPDASVAKVAMAHGINANLLRTWMTKHQRQLSACGSPRPSAATPAPFIPVVPVSAHRLPLTPPELTAQLPNGVRLEWSALSADQLAPVLRLLCTLPCSESIPG